MFYCFIEKCDLGINKQDTLTIFKKIRNNGFIADEYSFKFEKVFNEGSSQEDIFEGVARPVIERVLGGTNAAIFAYGQTGTGKTYSIAGRCFGGRQNDEGMLSRTFKYIFDIMKRTNDLQFHLGVSALEVYNEMAYDLLNSETSQDPSKVNGRVTLLGYNSGELELRNLSIHTVTTMDDVEFLMHISEMNRTVADTPLNSLSSRSHCIFILNLSQLYVGKDHIVKSKLSLIDLSGSERVMKSRLTGQILYEARQINLSLHYLEQVIIALSDPNRTHIPYRNSLVTSLLKDSLSGECVTVMIATISLEPKHFEETISTCRFAQRVSLIKWVPSRVGRRRAPSWKEHSFFCNQTKVQSSDTISELEDLRREVIQLKHQLRSAKDDRELTPSEKKLCEQFVKDYKGKCSESQKAPKDMATAKYCFKLLYGFLAVKRNQKCKEQTDLPFQLPLKRMDLKVRYSETIHVIETGITLLCTVLKSNPILRQLAEHTEDEMDSNEIRKLATILELDAEPSLPGTLHAAENEKSSPKTGVNLDFIDFLCTPEMKSSVTSYLKMNAMNYAQLESECSLWRIIKGCIDCLGVMYNELEEKFCPDGNTKDGGGERLIDIIERISREEDYLNRIQNQLEELRKRREDNLLVMSETKRGLWVSYNLKRKEKNYHRNERWQNFTREKEKSSVEDLEGTGGLKGHENMNAKNDSWCLDVERSYRVHRRSPLHCSSGKVLRDDGKTVNKNIGCSETNQEDKNTFFKSQKNFSQNLCELGIPNRNLLIGRDEDLVEWPEGVSSDELSVYPRKVFLAREEEQHSRSNGYIKNRRIKVENEGLVQDGPYCKRLSKSTGRVGDLNDYLKVTSVLASNRRHRRIRESKIGSNRQVEEEKISSGDLSSYLLSNHFDPSERKFRRKSAMNSFEPNVQKCINSEIKYTMGDCYLDMDSYYSSFGEERTRKLSTTYFRRNDWRSKCNKISLESNLKQHNLCQGDISDSYSCRRTKTRVLENGKHFHGIPESVMTGDPVIDEEIIKFYQGSAGKTFFEHFYGKK